MNAVAGHRGWVTVSVMLATVMQTIDMTIANVALPHMQGTMSASQDQISWVLTSYIVAAAICLPLAGYLAARMGRRRLFTICIAGFTLASILCGMASTLPQIVAARLLQGAFGAALVPLSQAIMLDAWPRERHAQAMALWGVGVMVGPILGPTLGGWLTDLHSWRWVFYINVPFGILAWLGVSAFVPETPIERDRRFDALGFALLILSIGSLQLMLDRGESLGWFSSGEIVVEALLASTCLAMFVVHMLTDREPFIEPALFRDRNFVVGCVFAFSAGIILLATTTLLPPFLQNLMNYPVVDVGVLLAPRGLGTMIGMLAVGRLSTRIEPVRFIFVGILLTAWSLFEMSRFNADIGAWPIVYTGLVQGAGVGLIFAPLSALSFSTMPARHRTEGAAFFNLSRNIGAAIGISIVVGELARNVQANHAAFSTYATPYNEALQLPGAGGASWDLSTSAGVLALNAEINHQAALLAYLQDFRLMMWVALLSLPLLLLFSRKRSGQAADPAESVPEAL